MVDALAGLVARTPEVAAHVDLGSYRVTTSSGSVLEVLAADAASSWGIKPAVVMADEVCQWPSTANARGLWEAMYSSLGKVPGARLLCISTSGDPAHWTRRIYDTAQSSPLWTVADVPGPLAWVSTAYLDEQRRMLPESSFQRLHMNEWCASEDRLTSVEDLRACVLLDGPLEPEPNTRYVIGVDIGLKRDRTVCAICHAERDREGVRVVLDRMEVWAGSLLRPVDLGGVETWLAREGARYNHAQLVVDPYQAIGLMQRLSRGGLVVEAYTFSQASVGQLAIALHTAIRDHRIVLPDDAELISELSNVRLRETSTPGVIRMDHDSGRHDDRAIALALAVQKLIQSGFEIHPYRPQRPGVSLLNDPRSTEQFVQERYRGGPRRPAPPGEPAAGDSDFTGRQTRDPGWGRPGGSLWNTEF